jgi:hypothetical protein
MAKKIKLQKYTWLIVAAIVVLAVIVLSSGESGALAKYYAAAKITPVPATTTVTYQGVLTMLNNCDSDIVENGKNCNTYCATRFTNGVCIASEVLEPVSYGTSLEGTRQNCNQDGYRKMCTCCAP